MELAINIAEKARGLCNPNPNVGAVIVKKNKIIGQGYTLSYGSDHAEIQAIKNCNENPKDADLYVTLEPCSHYGKTPPCTESIIKAGIKNVYAGIQDPNPKVKGKGFTSLKEAGIKTNYPFFEKEISKQLEVYLHWIQYKKPFVIMKNAVSLDGKIAAENGDSKWITSETSRKKVHELRQEADAVLTTINTLLKDDPLLNVRLEDKKRDPIRIILDPKLEIPYNSQIYKTIKEQTTIIFFDKDLPIKHSLDAIPVSCKNNFLDFNEILSILADKNITSIMVEAGPTLNSYLLKNNYVNKLYYFIAPKIIGGTKNVYHDLDILRLENQLKIHEVDIKIFGSDILVSGYLKVN